MKNILDINKKDVERSVLETVLACSGEGQNIPPIETVTCPNVDTVAAAYYLNRKAQTLRIWACKEKGPIAPLHINGRLAWPVSRIKELTGVAA